jgi:hypothetical protein
VDLPFFHFFFLILFQLNVILSSSEHSFPFKLKKLNFNSDDLSLLLFFNEVSPRDCYDLLVKKWGVGENLAIALMSVYGGHLYNISKAINGLALSNGNFITPLSSRASADILTLLEDNYGYAGKSSKTLRWNSNVVVALKSLAEKGFYAIDKPRVNREGEPESLVEQFSHLYIAGIVERNSIVPGVPHEMWDGKSAKTFVVLFRSFH